MSVSEEEGAAILSQFSFLCPMPLAQGLTKHGGVVDVREERKKLLVH
jgi:hypothetical protein